MKRYLIASFITVFCGCAVAAETSPKSQPPKGAKAQEIFVAPNGQDTADGTRKAPLQSFAAAQQAARRLAGKGPVTVTFADGVYYLPQTVVFTAADSGTAAAPVVYQAATERGAVLSGGVKLALIWSPYKDGILQAQVPADLDTEEIFINGERQILARYPNFDPSAKFDGFAADAFSPQRAARWANPVGGYFHAMHPSLWGGFTWRITGKNAAGEIEKEGGWQNNRGGSIHKSIHFVENLFEELDAPGEWFLNRATHTLYYYPPAGLNLATATIEATRLRGLVEFRGSEEKPVCFVSLRGFTFRQAARTVMDTKEPLLRTDWAIYRGGAIYLEGTEDCALEDSLLDQLGGNAVFVNNYNRRVAVRRSEIAKAGASGICFVGETRAARNALDNFVQRNEFSAIDQTPGPANNNYPAQCLVEDCLIYLTGRVEKQTAGVNIDLAQDITVRHCSIYDMPRAGINIGDGCWGGHVIEFCDVFDTVKETGDHGSFNSWGRDRFWGLRGAKAEDLPALALLDVVKPNILRNNRWRCDHGWDVDLDDGSSNYEIYNNVFLLRGLKLREGFHRKVWNNIAVNNSFHPHCWYNNSGDEVTRNIWMGAYRPAKMPNGQWGKEVDRNLFMTSEADRKKFAVNGCDANSLVGGAMFIDPAKGDFRVKDGSPALALGFVNFPMDQFGVVSPGLKAKARTPIIPAIELVVSARAADQAFWLGATAKPLEGDEYSAFGVGKDDGGIQLLNVPAKSAAASAGLAKGDLVLSLNGTKIAKLSDLFAFQCSNGAAPVKAGIVRSQQAKTLDLGTAPFLIMETANTPDGFKGVSPQSQASRGCVVTANQKTKNDPLSVLTDGALARSYGPGFPNRIANGAYKLDLGSAQPIAAVNSWSCAMGPRDQQSFTVYASASASDPGWNIDDAALFVPLGTVDTRSTAQAAYRAISLRAKVGSSLGTYRWFVWCVSPITEDKENTSMQELGVEIVK